MGQGFTEVGKGAFSDRVRPELRRTYQAVRGSTTSMARVNPRSGISRVSRAPAAEPARANTTQSRDCRQGIKPSRA